jgi:hypothetical protein
MLQKMGLLQNSKQGRDKQLRIDEQNERRLERKQIERARREQERKEREAVTITPSYFKANTNTRSNKFDY